MSDEIYTSEKLREFSKIDDLIQIYLEMIRKFVKKDETHEKMKSRLNEQLQKTTENFRTVSFPWLFKYLTVLGITRPSSTAKNDHESEFNELEG